MTLEEIKTTPKQTKTDQNRPKKKRKPKYNWSNIRLDFLQSANGNLKDFLSQKYGIDYRKNSYARKMTKGWSKARSSIHEEAQGQAQKEVEKEIIQSLVENYKVPIKQLNQMKKAGFDLLTAFLSSEASKISEQIDPITGEKEMIVTGGIDVQKIIKVVDKVKIELKEPTTITENHLGKEEKEIEKAKTRINKVVFT